MKKITCCTLLIIQAFLFSAHAQQHHWLQYTTADGLISNSIEVVTVQDPQNIWIGNANGLTHFDGSTFTNYNSTNSNLLSNTITRIKFNNQFVFIFTTSGLSVFDGVNFINYTTTTNSVSLTNFTDVVVDLQGNLWMSKQGEIIMFDGTKFTDFPQEMGQSLAVDSSNKIFSLTVGIIDPPFFNDWYTIYNGSNWVDDSISTYTYPQQKAILDHTESHDVFSWNKTAIALHKYFFANVSYPFVLQNTTLRLNSNERTSRNLIDIQVDKNNNKWVLTQYQLYFGDDTLLNYYAIPNIINFNCMDIENDMIAIGTDEGLFIGNINIKANQQSVNIELNANQIRTYINSWGSIFEQAYAPKDSNTSFVYSSNFIIAAKTANEQFNVHPLNVFEKAMQAGPYITDSNIVALEKNYIVNVKREEILQHQTQFNQTNYTMPEGIRNWPANADSTYNMAMDLAPYIDANNNNCYDPQNGDYPEILGDEAVYWINHPSNKELMLEYHGMIYGFNDSTNSGLDQTVFLKYTIVNRNTVAYDSVKVFYFTDFDIGYPNDDYIGSDSLENIFYAYNGDMNDNNSGPSNGYGRNTLAAGIKFLSDSMLNAISLNNQFPQSVSAWMHVSNNRWPNGQNIYYGGNGVNNPNPPTGYMYTGKPWLNSGWTELTPLMGLPAHNPGDRKMVASIPYFSLQPGERKSVDLVLGYGQDSTLNTVGRNLPELFQVLNSAKSVWDTLPQSGGVYSQNYCKTTGINEHVQAKFKLNIYPNPSTGSYTIDSGEEINALQVFDMQGRELINKSINDRNKVSIDLSEYNNGFFVVRVQTKDKNWFTQKVALFK